jgi:hypothetical protein
MKSKKSPFRVELLEEGYFGFLVGERGQQIFACEHLGKGKEPC